LPDIYDYVSSLQEAVETWYKMWNPLDSEFSDHIRLWLDKLNRLNLLGQHIYHPLVLVFLQSVSAESKRLAFLQAVERHLFIVSLSDRRFAYSYPFGGMDPQMFQLAIDLRAGKISGDKATKQIHEMTAAILKSHFIDEVIFRFRTEGFYEWDGIRYFLFEYNLDLQERSKTQRPKIFWPEFNERKDDFISVEHIFPQQPRHTYWQSRFNGLTQKHRTALRNSLGNLLPLSRPKNSSLSNKPFPDKIDGNNEPAVGYRYGCYAENEVSKCVEWTPSEILKRGTKMLEFLERRWAIQIGDLRSKKIMLGLEFMK
ncbi:MAG: HNH endonuclease family protein, partial [Chthoniobacteraceae bacterium]